MLVALTLLYAVAMLEGNRRFVWFDELCTLDIARAITIPLLWRLIGRFDFQPAAGTFSVAFPWGFLDKVRLAFAFPQCWSLRREHGALLFCAPQSRKIYATAAVPSCG